MKSRMIKMLAGATLGACVLFAGVAQAQSLTGTVARLLAADADWSYAYQDQSTYANQGQRHGTLVRFYDFATDGGAAGAISLEKGNVVTKVPDNSYIVGGYIEILTPFLPAATTTNSIGLNSAADIYAATTNLGSAAGTIFALTPVWTVATAVKTTNALPCNLTVVGTVTAGQFLVVMDYYYGQ